MSTEGYIELVVGVWGTGKSWFTRRELLAREIHEPDTFVCYHSPNEDDRFELGPPMTPAELERAKKMPRVCQLVGCTGLEAVRIVERAMQRYRVAVAFDEAHELVPALNRPFQDPYDADERRELRRWAGKVLHRGRHSRMAVILISQRISRMNVEIWEAARTVHYFRQEDEPDLALIRTRHGAAAALAVAELRDQKRITVDKAHPPAGWNRGIALELAREAARKR